MMRIITDTSALYSVKEGQELGFDVTPLQVNIAKKTYREYVDIQPEEFLKLIQQGNIPTSSQPAVGEFLDLFEKYKDDEIIVLAMADGLSGTYASCIGAKNSIDHHDNIHIINTKTLCGPHRYLLNLALKMRNEGASLQDILTTLQKKIDTSISFLLPQDFDYLKRGGRCTAVAAALGGFLKLQPVMIQTKDGKKLDKFATSRSFDLAIKSIIKHLKENHIDETYEVSVSHGFVEEQAKKVVSKIHDALPGVEVKLYSLSCAFLTQGGPGCIAIQAIQK